jgi:hypothetical protein
VLEALADTGITGWPLWTWLTSPTALLSGEIPEQLARRAPARVLRAAQRFASTAARPTPIQPNTGTGWITGSCRATCSTGR